MNTLKGLGSDIKLRSIKQVSASLLADDDVPDTLLDWTSEFAGQWEDDRTADEVIEDIRGARTSNRGHYKIFCVNGNTGFRNESRIFYFIHLQNEEAYERKESSSA